MTNDELLSAEKLLLVNLSNPLVVFGQTLEEIDKERIELARTLCQRAMMVCLCESCVAYREDKQR